MNFKKQLFKDGARAVKELTNITEEIYVCPICGDGYDEEGLQNNKLTIEHVPPAAIGGNKLLLTCKNCNSKAGHTIDAAVKKREETNSFLKNILLSKGEFKEPNQQINIGGETLNAEITGTKDNVKINIISKINHPAKNEYINSYMNEKFDQKELKGEEFNLRLKKKFDPKMAQVSDLKTAFLLIFALYGYRYAMHDRLLKVREQILTPENQIIELFTIFLGRKSSEKNYILYVEKPFEMIVVKLSYRAIFLPWYIGPENFYEKINKELSGQKQFNIEGKKEVWPRKPIYFHDYRH